MFISDRRLYLTADDEVVEDGDPRAATLLVGEGGQVDDETVKRYKLKNREPDEKGKTSAENKAVSKAPANKSKE